MRKAKLSVHATDVKKVLAAYSIDVAASSQEDLAEVRGRPCLARSNPNELGARVALALTALPSCRNRSSSGCDRRAVRATTAHDALVDEKRYIRLSKYTEASVERGCPQRHRF